MLACPEYSFDSSLFSICGSAQPDNESRKASTSVDRNLCGTSASCRTRYSRSISYIVCAVVCAINIQ